MNDFLFISDLMIVVLGLYLARMWWQIKWKRQVPGNSFLLPQGKPPEQCRDMDGYGKSIQTPVLFMALCLVVAGGLLAANDKYDFLIPWMVWALLGGLVLAGGWFAWIVKQKIKAYWD